MEKTMVAWLMVAAVSSAPTITPTESVQAAVEQVLGTIQDSDSTTGSTAVEWRRGEIRRIVGQLVDFPEMARRALARHWKERTPQERHEFVRLFTRLLERSYLGKLESYSGEEIVYTGETVEGEFATVRSKIITSRHGEIPIEYRLHVVDSRWVIYDIRIEGVSFVSVYRSQFNRIIRAASYAELVSRLRLREVESEALEGRAASAAAPAQ